MQMTDVNVVYTVEIVGFSTRYTFREMCEISHLAEAVVTEYIDYDVIVADGPAGVDFTQKQLDRLMKAFRLQRDLEINTPGVALVIELMDSNQHLEQKIKQLKMRTILSID
ncbi:MAG: chaperone modulatory protein CbpM [Porticoccaceae bacterium]|jgi:chaperone modulatory protein CbpM